MPAVQSAVIGCTAAGLDGELVGDGEEYWRKEEDDEADAEDDDEEAVEEAVEEDPVEVDVAAADAATTRWGTGRRDDAGFPARCSLKSWRATSSACVRRPAI